MYWAFPFSKGSLKKASGGSKKYKYETNWPRKYVQLIIVWIKLSSLFELWNIQKWHFLHFDFDAGFLILGKDR